MTCTPEARNGQTTESYVHLGQDFLSLMSRYPRRDITFRVQYVPSFNPSSLRSSHRHVIDPESNTDEILEIKRSYFIITKKKIYDVVEGSSIQSVINIEEIPLNKIHYIAVVQENIRDMNAPIEIVFLFKKENNNA